MLYEVPGRGRVESCQGVVEKTDGSAGVESSCDRQPAFLASGKYNAFFSRLSRVTVLEASEVVSERTSEDDSVVAILVEMFAIENVIAD